MLLKRLAIAVLAVFVLAIGWRLARSDWARSLAQPASKPAVEIKFDNGTVRQYDSAASVAERSRGQPKPLGTLRRCQRGTEVSYTDSFCPPGTRELAVGRGTVNVVGAAAPAAKPASAMPQPTLRELAVERAVERATSR